MNKELVLICLVCVFTATANADDEVHPFISSKYTIKLGAYSSSRDFKLSVGTSVSGIAPEFDFERATGISEDHQVFMAEFKWRLGEKWSTRMQYFEADHGDKKVVLKENVYWRNQILAAGSNVTAGTNFSLTRVFLGRSFDRHAKVDAGIGFGLHLLAIGSFVKPDFNTIGDFSAASVSGPMPNIGGWYFYSPSPKWIFGGRIDWLKASAGKFDGGILNVSAGANYQMFSHVGLGLSYQLFRLDVDVAESNWHGGINLEYTGPYFHISASFN